MTEQHKAGAVAGADAEAMQQHSRPKAEDDAGKELDIEANSTAVASEATPDEPTPDGGYGWVVVGATFLMAACTWGLNSTFGVFLSFYRANNYFPGATNIQYSFVGGVSVSVAMFVAPLTNYVSKRFGFRTAMLIGVGFTVLGQIFAGLSKEIWQLFITQGLMFGAGIGMTFVAANPICAQWFDKQRSLAIGLTAAGSGGGQLVFSITTRLAIENISLKYAFIINGLISLVVLVPVTFVIRTRASVQKDARFEPLDLSWLVHPGTSFVYAWAFFSIVAYTVALFTVATYATEGLSLSQTKGSNVQALLAAGQMIGRPLCGILLDRYGRLNMASLLSVVAGMTCLVIWMFARSYGVLMFFAFVQGVFGGVVWGSAAPVCAEMGGLKHLGSILSLFWLSIGPGALVAEPIATALISYSRRSLHREGADAFLITIGLSGGCFIAAGLVLLGGKRWKQGSWKVMQKT